VAALAKGYGSDDIVQEAIRLTILGSAVNRAKYPDIFNHRQVGHQEPNR